MILGAVFLGLVFLKNGANLVELKKKIIKNKDVFKTANVRRNNAFSFSVKFGIF